MSPADENQLSERLSSEGYLRERLKPQPGDLMYLHLSDLRMAMERVATNDDIRILDFGCGGSPYQTLFPSARYERADVPGTPEIDYEISMKAGSLLPLPDETYDMVLSSQVLEHVEDPQSYLSEARRVLRVGGRLVITTHGIFEDHACPFDFRRWTDAGLLLELNNAGFQVSQILKMTTGPRAAMFLWQQHRGYPRKNTRLGFPLWLLNRLVHYRRAKFDSQCDQEFGENRVVTDQLDQHRIYIALMAVAERAH
jgi:SAM-dependent methyltransferase